MKLVNIQVRGNKVVHQGGIFAGFVDFTFAGEVALPNGTTIEARTFISSVSAFVTNDGKFFLNFPERTDEKTGEKHAVAAPANAETRGWLTDVASRLEPVAEAIREVAARGQAPAQSAPMGAPQTSASDAKFDALAALVLQLTQSVQSLTAQQAPAAAPPSQQSPV